MGTGGFGNHVLTAQNGVVVLSSDLNIHNSNQEGSYPMGQRVGQHKAASSLGTVQVPKSPVVLK